MKARRLTTILFLLLPVAALRSGHAQDTKKPGLITSDLGGVDMQFLVAATEQGRVQAELGEIAVTHAQSPDVVTFGRALAKENAVQSEQIKLLAINKGLDLPENLNPPKNAAAAKLDKLKGLKFDKAYVQEMLVQMQKCETIFEGGLQSHDPDIKAFATSTLPVIKAASRLPLSHHGRRPAPPAPRHCNPRVNVSDPPCPRLEKISPGVFGFYGSTVSSILCGGLQIHDCCIDRRSLF